MPKSPITKIRNKAGISQKALARAIDVNTNTLSRLETAENDAEEYREVFESIAELTDLDVDTLIEKQEEFKREKRRKEIEETRNKLKNMDMSDEFSN